MYNIDLYNRAFLDVFDLPEEADLEVLTQESTEEWDSIGHMNLVSEIEKLFGIELESEDLLVFQSYEEGLRILKKYGVFFHEN